MLAEGIFQRTRRLRRRVRLRDEVERPGHRCRRRSIRPPQQVQQHPFGHSLPVHRWNQTGDPNVERIAKRGEAHRGGIEWPVPSEQLAPILLVKPAAHRKAHDRDQSLETPPANRGKLRLAVEEGEHCRSPFPQISLAERHLAERRERMRRRTLEPMPPLLDMATRQRGVHEPRDLCRRQRIPRVSP